MPRLVINKFGGISNDPSVGGAGSVYNAEGVDVHSDSKEVKLAKSFSSMELINERTNGKIVGSIYESLINYLELSRDGYLTGISNTEISNGPITTNISDGYNIGKITTAINTYGFIIGAGDIYQWIYNSSSDNLGTYSTSTGINTDPEFSLGTGWTIGANWVISGGLATHTPGSTAVLSRAMTPVAAQDYRLSISGTVIAGTCVVKIAGTTVTTLSTSTNSTIPVEIYTAAGTSELLEFIPSTDFNGNITYCRIQVYNVIAYTKTFNESAPYLILDNFIYIGNGNVVTEIDTTTGTWVILDVVSIDTTFTIKGITKIGDQIFIYSTDGNSTRQYLWDGASAFVGRSITWVDKPVINVANFANWDYVITGGTNRQTLSLVNGYQLQPIIQTGDYVDIDNRIYFSLPYTNSIETIGNQLLLGGIGGIFTYGNKKPGFDKALIKEFLHSGGSINSMFFSESLGYSLYTYTYGTIQGVTGNYRTIFSLLEGGSETYGILNNRVTGWMELNPMFGQTYSNQKNFEKIISGISLETSTQVNVYKKGGQFANVYITGSSYTFAAGDTYTNGGRTYTVISVTKATGKSGYILHCSYDGAEITSGKITGTFTRTAGSGPATTYVNLVRYGYELIRQITDDTDTTVINAFNWNKTQFAIELISFDSSYTPHLFDLNLYYGEKDDN